MLSEGTLRAHAHLCHLAIACPLWLTPGLLLPPRHCHPAPSYTYRGVSPREPTNVHCDERLAQPPGRPTRGLVTSRRRCPRTPTAPDPSGLHPFSFPHPGSRAHDRTPNPRSHVRHRGFSRAPTVPSRLVSARAPAIYTQSRSRSAIDLCRAIGFQAPGRARTPRGCRPSTTSQSTERFGNASRVMVNVHPVTPSHNRVGWYWPLGEMVHGGGRCVDPARRLGASFHTDRIANVEAGCKSSSRAEPG